MRDDVVQAAIGAIGKPAKAAFPLACLSAAKLKAPAKLTELRSIWWPEPGERRSAENVPLPGDIAYFDGADPNQPVTAQQALELAGVITALGATEVECVRAEAGVATSILVPRSSVAAIYSIRSLIEAPVDVEARMRAGASDEDLRADGVSIGEVERARAALAPVPTAEQTEAAELAELQALVKRNIDAEVQRLRKAKRRDDLHMATARDMYLKGDISGDEYVKLVPGAKLVTGAPAEAMAMAQAAAPSASKAGKK